MDGQTRPPDLDEHGNPIAAGSRPPDLDEHGNPIAAAGKPAANDAGPLKRFIKGVGRMGIGTDDPYGAFVEHPGQSALGVLRTMRDNVNKGATGEIPASMPAPLMTDSIRKGDYAGAAGEGVGFLGGLKLFHSLGPKAEPPPPTGGASIGPSGGGGFATDAPPTMSGTSGIPAPKPAGTLPWSTTIPAGPEPPPVTGTGSTVSQPPTGPAQPWTMPRPAAPAPTPPPMTGTGNAPAGGPVSWGNWKPPIAEPPTAPTAPAAPAPVMAAGGADPMAGAPIAIKSLTARPPDVDLGGFTERSKYPAPVAEPLAPVKEQPPDAGPAGELDLQNQLGARDAAAKLGVSPDELRNRTGQRGKPPSDAAARIAAAVDKMTPEQMQTEVATSKNAKLVEAIKARLKDESGFGLTSLAVDLAGGAAAKAGWKAAKWGASKAGPLAKQAAESPWSKNAIRAAMLAEMASASQGEKKDDD